MNNTFLYKLLSITKTSLFWSVLMFVALAVTIIILVGNVSNTVSEEGLSLLENSVRRSAIQCYVIEGSYPPNLAYLTENYGLYYDSENYVVHYQNIGSNLLPEIDAFYLSEK